MGGVVGMGVARELGRKVGVGGWLAGGGVGDTGRGSGVVRGSVRCEDGCEERQGCRMMASGEVFGELVCGMLVLSSCGRAFCKEIRASIRFKGNDEI
ncbi:hypothetical protein Tco_0007592 [Tanacetum coccineum]